MLTLFDNILFSISQVQDHYRENKILDFLREHGEASALLIEIKTGIHGVRVESRLMHLNQVGLVQEHDGKWSLRG